MKKFLLIITLFGATNVLKAQNYDAIKFILMQKKVDEAKAGLDKLLLDPKQASKPEVVYLKAKIYNELSKDPKRVGEAYNNKVTAFETFNSYLLSDKKAKLLAEDPDVPPYLDIYAGFVDLGGVSFNNKNYGDALKNYVKAQEVENVILEKGFTFPSYPQIKFGKVDTSLILNSAATCLNLKDSAAAVKYYTKLIDASVSGADYESVYDVVVRYHMDHGDAANFKANLLKAQKVYPGNVYWSNLEMDYLSKNDKPAMFALYEQNFVKNPTDKIGTMNYGIELYNKYYNNATVKDSSSSAKLIQVLKTAIDNGDETNNGNVLLANHLYNVAADLSEKADKIKSLKPADVKRKKDLTSQSVGILNQLIPYAESSVKFFKALPSLKLGQKSNYRSAAGYLAEAYKATKNVAKATEYQKLMDSISLK
jgi:hypothetical protein